MSGHPRLILFAAQVYIKGLMAVNTPNCRVAYHILCQGRKRGTTYGDSIYIDKGGTP